MVKVRILIKYFTARVLSILPDFTRTSSSNIHFWFKQTIPLNGYIDADEKPENWYKIVSSMSNFVNVLRPKKLRKSTKKDVRKCNSTLKALKIGVNGCKSNFWTVSNCNCSNNSSGQLSATKTELSETALLQSQVSDQIKLKCIVEQVVEFHTGGWGPVNPADGSMQTLLDPLRQEVEDWIFPMQVDEFIVISYRVQVVAGENIFAKVRIGDNSNIHIFVFSQSWTPILELQEVWCNF
ncbi:unnamed protein product, partial [Meganyctiphanes norvegica]